MKRRRKRTNIVTKVIWVFLLMFIFSNMRTWYIQERESRSLNQQQQQYQAQIDQLEEEIERLRHTLENITDDEYIEAMARKNLKMVKENEWVLIDIQNGRD